MLRFVAAAGFLLATASSFAGEVDGTKFVCYQGEDNYIYGNTISERAGQYYNGRVRVYGSGFINYFKDNGFFGGTEVTCAVLGRLEYDGVEYCEWDANVSSEGSFAGGRFESSYRARREGEGMRLKAYFGGNQPNVEDSGVNWYFDRCR